jgi:hypothetical protein
MAPRPTPIPRRRFADSTDNPADVAGERSSWELGPGVHRLLAIASVLVAVAGFQLFVLSEHTDRYFAWTIEPLSAAMLGASC